MVDFKNKLRKKELPKRVNPVEIYDTLDRKSDAGPLRPSQIKILNTWFSEKKERRDNIIKLHTGEGKTLIGLLILQSKLNETGAPCLYVCPNIYLAKQAVIDAEKFGIPYCIIDSSKKIPDDFLAGKKILITHVQKIFNGVTVFGLGAKSIVPNSIILDDSQACIDAIKNCFTIKINREHEIYNQFMNIFADELKEQGEGSFLEIESGIGHSSVLPIPYWSWIDKKEVVAKTLIQHASDNNVKYTWPLIKDNLHNCQAFISSESLEISPIVSLIDVFGTFSQAKHRFLMSATTQNDSFFIKGLRFDIDAVRDPLINPELIWSGEKMVLIPSLIDESLDRDKVISMLLKPQDQRKFGTVCLAPSFNNKAQYEKYGAIVSTTETIFSNIEKLKAGNFSHSMVFANRYDGIDLPDSSCRILIIDSKPYSESLAERYEEECRPSSDIINILTAQKVEQGLGRSVRGEKDYSVIVITGGDLVQFLKSPLTKKYFSPQTQMQIELGEQIVSFTQEDISKGTQPKRIFIDLISKSLSRDEGWKEYYQESMNEVSLPAYQNSLYDFINLEYLAEKELQKGEVKKACELIQRICDEFTNNEMEKAWYLQLQARFTYASSKVDSDRIQKSAFQKNINLLKPRDGVTYKKIESINSSRVMRVINWINSHETYESMMIEVDGILQNLSFGVQSEKFEQAISDLGSMLGFVSQRPDKEIKKGPDALWGGVDNQYFLIECKNEVKEDRKEINKHEAGQMNNHCGWFKAEYNDAACKNIMVISSKVLSYYGDFNYPVEVMRPAKLKTLKQNTRSFFKELKNYDIHSLDEATVHNFFKPHKLDMTSLLNEYTEHVVKSSK